MYLVDTYFAPVLQVCVCERERQREREGGGMLTFGLKGVYKLPYIYDDSSSPKYNNAGMTPQRRQFHYPSDLRQTRPHSDLLEEFRSAREAAMSLPQLPESDSEMETSSISVSMHM